MQPSISIVRQNDIKVVNIGGPLDNFITARSQRQDFIHIDLNRGPNTIVADVNKVELSDIIGHNVRCLRASNVPFVAIPTGSFVEPNVFARQAQGLRVRHIVITTGRFSELPISEALSEAGFSVQRRVIHQRVFITARQ
ncbi:MAG: hypothetical protein OXU36_20190 [Candidatus Poribacteria bacterium]|nr:hypothetical protein [Candidatus Poribacteria bacterium]